MHVLGLNDSNSAAALIRDGQLVAAAREERFDRIKFSDDFPRRAVNYCLKEAGIGIKDVDQVVFAWNPGHEIEPLYSAHMVRDHEDFLHYIPNNLLQLVGGVKENKKVSHIEETIGFQRGGSLKILYAPHHDCHAASAFFISPFDRAAVFTIDAYGDDITHQFFTGEGNSLKTLGKTMFPHSLGQVYAAVTQFLGYRANSDEWKVMGMAAYGEPEFYDQFTKIIRFDAKRGELRFDLDYFTYYTWSPRRYSDQFIEVFGQERQSGDELSGRHVNIAASFQRRVEDVILEMCVWLHGKTGLDALCLAGGVAMNSKMNGRILLETPFKKVWVQPSSDDAGCSLGACFHYWHQVLGNPRCFTMEHDYWGPGFTDAEIKAALDDSLVCYERLENPSLEAAKSIADNKVIAWFQGRMEFGQRALGNRSLLADARDPEMKNKINKMIKHREWYRPFAPSILEEYQAEFFDTAFPSHYMQMVFNVKEDKRKIVPAIVHNDGTGRIQTVSKTANPAYWELIDAFRRITGVPLVLNTSFNDNDEPIVCTPKDALRSFFGTGIQELYIGNYRVLKPGR